MIRYGLKQEQNGIILILGVCKRIYCIQMWIKNGKAVSKMQVKKTNSKIC